MRMADFLRREKTDFLKNHPKCFSGGRPFIPTGGMGWDDSGDFCLIFRDKSQLEVEIS
jgi:hypothetical protein